jgi:hypothetical protein
MQQRGKLLRGVLGKNLTSDEAIAMHKQALELIEGVPGRFVKIMTEQELKEFESGLLSFKEER